MKCTLALLVGTLLTLAGFYTFPADAAQPVAVPPARPAVVNRLQELTNWLGLLESDIPRHAEGFSKTDKQAVAKTAVAVEAWSFEQFKPDPATPNLLTRLDRVLAAKETVDQRLSDLLEMRSEFAAMPEPARRQAVLNYLATASSLIDLDGRIRYMLYDELADAFEEFVENPAQRDALLELLLKRRSEIGATVAATLLFEPADADPQAKSAVPVAAKIRIVQLISAARQTEQLPALVRLARTPQLPPELLLQAVDAIRQVGLPQDVRPNSPSDTPTPAVTPREFAELVRRIDAAKLPAESRPLHKDLLAFADERLNRGVVGSQRIGRADVQAGDWLLMRSPSPYNLVTDLNPGLFTHVGVVAEEFDAQKLRRLVVVDMPERGTKIPATNVELYVQRSLHYVFLRHPDPATAKVMSDTAASTIGNPSLFDLNFRTDRVSELKGQPLAGKKINTYCAGFLLLCTQATDRPREEFFPLAEAPAAGETRENLAVLGLTFGEKFISPTGALFAKKMKLVGRREPMYDARREVEEAVYDHFAVRLVDHTLTPSDDLFQSIRGKLTVASRDNPLLAKAIAAAANVSQDTDLVSAAKAAAVVETLDELAQGASGEFLSARSLLTAEAADKLTAADLAKQASYRKRHAALALAWEKEQISPRALRIELVKYYSQLGKDRLDARFFSAKK